MIERVKPEDVDEILRCRHSYEDEEGGEDEPRKDAELVIERRHQTHNFMSVEELESAKETLSEEEYEIIKADLTREHRVDKISHGMQWVEEDAAMSDEDQPELKAARDFLGCAEAISDYLNKNVSPSHYMDGEFIIPVPTDVHFLLDSRYDDGYSEESRRLVFRLVEAAVVFISQLDERGRKLDEKINDCFPTKTIRGEVRVPYGIRAMFLDDDPVTIGSEEPVVYVRMKVAKGFV